MLCTIKYHFIPKPRTEVSWMLGMMKLKPSPFLTPVVFPSILLCCVKCVITFDRNEGFTWFVTVNIPLSRIAG
jgi:hypothetical protein